jgi:cytochrome c peroxidase
MGIVMISITEDKMNHAAIPVLLFLVAAVSAPAQQPVQATLPIPNPVEMGEKDQKDVVAKLAAIPEFVEAFQKVFGRPPNWEDMATAFAAFERTRLSTKAPFDRFLHGDDKALNAAQRRGWGTSKRLG